MDYNLFTELQKRVRHTPDMYELINSKEPILLFDAIHLRVGKPSNILLKRSENNYLGEAHTSPSSNLIFRLSDADGTPFMRETAPNGNQRTIIGDLFSVSSITISILDRFFKNGQWMKRDKIKVYHQDTISGKLGYVDAYCYLGQTKYWTHDAGSFGYIPSEIGTAKTRNVGYYDYNLLTTK